MGAKEREAQKLWAMMLQLDKMPCKTPEEFRSKQREMDKLRAEYVKVTGLSGNPFNQAEQDALSKAKAYGSVVSRPDIETADSLNQIKRDVIDPLERGD